MPKSVITGKQIFNTDGPIVTQVELFQGKEVANTASFRCSQIISALICGLFAKLELGLSWFGKLTLEDVVFIEFSEFIEIYILKEPSSQNASDEEKTLDVQSLWPMMEGGLSSHGELPVYFEALKDDLLNAEANEVSQPWFLEYLIYHPSLVASMGRRNLETGIYQVVKQWCLHQHPNFKAIFDVIPLAGDWRDLVITDDFLGINYVHKNPGGKQRLGNPEEASHAKYPADDRYKNSRWSLLEFKRHGHIHPRVHLTDLDESEIFLAKISGTFLPCLLKNLLRKGRMNDQFAGVWSAYKCSKADKKRIPEGKWK